MTPDEVPGLISPRQGLLMQAFAAKMTGDFAVEVGSFQGKSAAYIASAMPNGAHLFCVDPWQDSVHVREERFRTNDNLAVFKDNIEACGLSDRVTPIRGFSLDVARTWNRPIGLLYIDGGHEYDEVLADIDAWTPHMTEGAVVMFDDFSPSFPGLMAAINDRFSEATIFSVGRYESKTKRGSPRWLVAATVR